MPAGETGTVHVCGLATASLQAAQRRRASLRPFAALPQHQPSPAHPPSATSALLSHTRLLAARDECWRLVRLSLQWLQRRSRQHPCGLLALLAVLARAWRLPLQLWP